MSYNPNQPGGYAPPSGAPGSTPPPYGGMQYGGGGGGNLLAIGEKRDPAMVIVYSILSCGIYALWWWHQSATEMKNALGREDLNPTTDLIIGLVTCGIGAIYFFGYKYPKLLPDMQQRAGLPVNDISMVTLLTTLFGVGVIGMFMQQTELNKIWDAAQSRR